MKLTIINYGSGNLHSVHKAFEKVNSNIGSPYNIMVTSNPLEINESDKIVLPGVGAFNQCKNSLLDINNLYETLEDKVIQKKIPFMGICVGMQLLANKAYEFGKHNGFGWIEGEVVKLKTKETFQVPHMGWNEVCFEKHPLFTNCKQGTDFYFVHSFHFKAAKKENVLATTNYSETITAAVINENIFGTQFHPEKSHENGKKIIENFLNWKP